MDLSLPIEIKMSLPSTNSRSTTDPLCPSFICGLLPDWFKLNTWIVEVPVPHASHLLFELMDRLRLEKLLSLILQIEILLSWLGLSWRWWFLVFSWNNWHWASELVFWPMGFGFQVHAYPLNCNYFGCRLVYPVENVCGGSGSFFDFLIIVSE